MKFADDADENLRLSRAHSWTLADLLEQKKLSYEFCHDYLLPIGAAIWSTPEKHMLDFPAETFLVFFMNHKLLQVNNRPVWKTVKNGSINYIQKIAQQLRHVHLNAPVESVERRDGRVHVKTTTESLVFDKVVLATHAPITSKILKAQSDLESQILSPFYYTENQTLLHADSSFMPQRKRCWSSWNVIGATEKSGPQNVCLSYYLNKLQPLKTKNDYFVTLNPIRQVQKVIQEFSYSHPQFDQKAIQAQNKLPVIQGNGGVYFAGAWSRYGFHEDGLLSAVRVAQQFDIQVPWSID